MIPVPVPVPVPMGCTDPAAVNASLAAAAGQDFYNAFLSSSFTVCFYLIFRLQLNSTKRLKSFLDTILKRRIINEN
jgi:hypothetical protein